MFAPAPDDSKLKKTFDSIYEKRKLFEEKVANRLQEGVHEQNDISQERKELINATLSKRYPSNTSGTARLLLLKTRRLITMIKKTEGSKYYNRETSVCIDNATREEFFRDSKTTRRHKPGRFEIREEDNKELFDKWVKLINNTYQNGLLLYKKEN